MRSGMPPEEFENQWFRVGHAETIGRRPTMEDAASIQLFFRDHEPETYIGVFDGHGGPTASEFASKFLHDLLSQGLDSGEYEQETERLLTDCFLEVNDLMSQHSIQDGTTALVPEVTLTLSLFCCTISRHILLSLSLFRSCT